MLGDTSIVPRIFYDIPDVTGDKAQIQSKNGKVEKEPSQHLSRLAQELLHMSTGRWLRP
jgi:hypothetical protein